LALHDEALDHPVGEPEEAHLLGRRRVDGEAVRVVGEALRPHHVRRPAVEPHPALAQDPVGRRPRHHQDERLPPAVVGQHDRGRDAGDEADQPVGDEVHAVRQRRSGDAEVEVAGHRQVIGEVGPLEVGDARGVERRRHQPIVERRRRAVAEVVPERLVQRADDLAGDEHDGHRDERTGQRGAVGDGGDQPTRRDGDQRRQGAACDQPDPPQHGVARRRPADGAEQRPLLAGPQPGDHAPTSFMLRS
jgi:hypothetical protein